MNGCRSKRPWSVRLAAAVLLTAAAWWAECVRAPDGRAGAQPGEEASTGAYLPLVARHRDVLAVRPRATTQPATPTPTAVPATPTDEATATPRATPTPTVFACPPLADRIRVRSIDVYPLEVKVPHDPRGASSPVFVAPEAVGEGARVAWSDTEGRVHVTGLDYYDLPTGQEFVVEGDEVRGLVVHADGVALLVVRGDSLYLVRLNADGGLRFETRLVGGGSQTVAGSKWVDSWGHEARLVFGRARYAVYSGHTQYFGARGKHQGDLLWFFDAAGRRADSADGWDWGCSHSLDLRLADNGQRLGAVCLSDSYPSKGIHLNHDEKRIRSEPSGDGAGYSAANLGGWVPEPDGFLLAFSSPEGRASSDVGLVKVTNQASIGPVQWLTDSADTDETAPHLARYGAGYLVGWIAAGRHLVAQLDARRVLRLGPVEVDARIAARDDMVTFPNGDVLWAYSWTAPANLDVVRVEACSDGG